MRDKKYTLLSISFLFIIFVSFFYKFFFKQLIPVASDITVGMYYPWLNNKYGYPVRVPFKNATLTDTVSQFWIWRNWAIDSLKTGKISIWNPYSFAGYQLSPWFHTILFQPSNIFYFIFSKTTAMGLVVSIQLLFILISTFVFLKYHTKSNFTSVFGSIVFSLSSYSLGWLTWGTVTFSLATLPLILLYLDKLSKMKSSVADHLGLSVAVLFCILGGHPQTIFYCALISCLYYFVKLKQTINLKIISLSILGILMASFVLLPSLEIINDSIRTKDVFIANQNYGYLNYADVLISTVSQSYFGNPGTQNYWGNGATMQEKLSGVSIVALILAILYLLTTKINSKTLSGFGTIITIIGVLLATKYPLGWLIYYLKIPLLSTSPASRSMILVVFGIMLMSVESLIKLINNQYKSKDLLKSFLMILTIILILYLPIFYFKYQLAHQVDSVKKILLPASINTNISLRNLTLTLAYCIFTIVILIFTKITSKQKINYIFIFILVLIPIAEGFYFGWKYTPFTDPKFYFPTTPGLDFLITKQKTNTDFFRIEREKGEILPPNMWQAYNLYSFSGYDPIYPQNYADFLINNKILSNYSRYFEIDQYSLSKFQNLGLKYLLIINRDENGNTSSNGTAPYWTQKNNWKNVFQENNVSVLENQKYQPPYGLLSKKSKDTVSLLSHVDDNWKFIVTNSNSTDFYLLENNHKNWKAIVNNRPQTISNYLGTFKSIHLDPGINTIIFKYENMFYNYGIIISLFALITTIVSAFYYSKNK